MKYKVCFYKRMLLMAFIVISPLLAHAQCTVEYYWDKDPGVGKGSVLTTSSENNISFSNDISVQGLSKGVHILGLRTLNKTSKGTFISDTQNKMFLVSDKSEWQLATVEYYWDTDPGIGKGTVLTKFDSNNTTYSNEISVQGLKKGVHVLGLRTLNKRSDGTFLSDTQNKMFFVAGKEETPSVTVEYYWDNDPGVGKGNLLTSSGQNNCTCTQEISVEGLSKGVHTLGLRTLNKRSDGTFLSDTQNKMFFVAGKEETPSVTVEYYWDNDPGVGNATILMASTDKSTSCTKEISVAGLSKGVHTLGLRTLNRNPDGTFVSDTQRRMFMIPGSTGDQVAYVEYYWDTDPGQGNGTSLDVTPASEITMDTYASVAGMTGTHSLFLRAQSATGNWSTVYNAGEVDVTGEYEDQKKNITYCIYDPQESYDNSDTTGVYKQINYQRTFSNTDWQTLYVPFTLSFSEWSNDFEVARLNDVHQYDDNNDGTVDRVELEAFLVTEGSLEPNTPYLIKANTTGEKILSSIAAPTLYNAEENTFQCSSMSATFTFKGNYSTIPGTTMKGNRYYTLTDNRLVSGNNGDLGAFRWYLAIEGRSSSKVQPESVMVKIGTDFGDATAIKRVMGGKANDTSATIIGYYTIDGVKLNSPQKGIVIVKFSDGTARRMVISY